MRRVYKIFTGAQRPNGEIEKLKQALPCGYDEREEGCTKQRRAFPAMERNPKVEEG